SGAVQRRTGRAEEDPHDHISISAPPVQQLDARRRHDHFVPAAGGERHLPTRLGYAPHMPTRSRLVPSALLVATLAAAATPAAILLRSATARAEEIDLETVARDLVRDLADGKYDEVVKHFSPQMAKEIGRDQLAIQMDPLRAQRGHAKYVHARL